MLVTAYSRGMSQPTPPMATPRVAAGALFYDSQGRVLLVRPTYKPHWDVPGGYVEPGESPTAACAREVREELGIEPMLGSLLVVDWAPNPGEGDKMLFIFDGGELAPDQEARIRLESAELSEYAFTDPERFDEVLIPRLSRRLRLAIDAHRDGRPIYAEHGASASHATA
jgi:8-oxo-dGTP diphosphatase